MADSSGWTRRGVLAAAGTSLAACTTPLPVEPAMADPFPELEDQSHTVEPISSEERVARRKRTAELLSERGVDALIAEAGATMTWLTGVSWGRSERLFALVLLASGEHFWLCPGFEAPKARKRVGNDELVVWEEHEYASRPLAAALAARGAERLAVDPQLRFFAVDGLQRATSNPVRSAADLVLALRGRKDAHELALMRRASELTQQALRVVGERLREGMTGAEIGAMVTAAQQKLGLRNIWQLSLVGPDAAFPHGADQSRPIRRGDVVLIDTGGSLHGYQSDTTRTWVLGGEPSDEVRKVWTAVRDAQRRAFEAIRPGVTGASIDRVARESLEKAGFGSGYTHFTHRLGHGIGLRGHEGPYLDGGNEVPLEVGNTMSNEPGIYLYDRFGVRIEDIVVVTEEGADHFGEWQRGPEAP